MRALSFNEGVYTPRYQRMSRRAWYVVFGSPRLHQSDRILTQDLVERLHSVYNDIDQTELTNVIENYLEQRSHTDES